MTHIREHLTKGEYALHFTVEGSGQFPVDMLRYDACYPAAESQSPAIAMTPNDEGYFKKRRVELAARPVAGDRWVNVTPDRWKSFSWKVVAIDGKPYNE